MDIKEYLEINYNGLLELARSGKKYCCAKDISEYLDSDPNTIRAAAKASPKEIGFATVSLGKRLCIPIIPFIEVMSGASFEAIAETILSSKKGSE